MSLDQPASFVKQQSVTRDAFLGGRITVSQPAKGFRAGLDAVLLGSAVDRAAAGLLDLGAGVGTAALVALAHNAQLSAVLVEIDPAMAELAQSNLAANGFSGRGEVIVHDLLAKRTGTALDQARFDCVMANPPFFASGRGTPAPDTTRATARHMPAKELDAWVRAAAASLVGGGEAIFIHRTEALTSLLASFEHRFGALTILPIAPRPQVDAKRVLVRGRLGSRAPMRLLAPLVLHGPEGNGFGPAADTIFRGEARLDW